MNRKVIVYIAASLDGYIATPGDNLDFLSIVQKEGEDYGYEPFIKSVDTVILGRKTYDWVMKQVPEFPHSDKETFVITSTARPSIGKTHFYNDDIEALLTRLMSVPGQNIFIDGGAQLVNAFLQKGLVDEFILSIIPILVGDGIRLFTDGRPEQQMQLISSRQFDTGLVQLHYKKHTPGQN